MLPLLMALTLSPPTSMTCCGPQSMASFANDNKFLAAHLSPLAFKFHGGTGRSVRFAVPGKSGGGYYVPPTKGSHVAIIMVHEYWGLNDYIRREAERLHKSTGYAVLAMDLYDGKMTTDPAAAGRLMQSVKDARASAIAAGALRALETGKLGFKPKHIGTVGYCFGGGWSQRTAVIGSNHVQACVVYYGMPDIRPASLARLKAPVLMFQGSKDQWINDKVVADFQAAMATAGKTLTVKVYDENHAFANPSNPHYSAVDAGDAMKRELAFFKANL